jgi:hypothetical protein
MLWHAFDRRGRLLLVCEGDDIVEANDDAQRQSDEVAYVSPAPRKHLKRVGFTPARMTERRSWDEERARKRAQHEVDRQRCDAVRVGFLNLMQQGGNLHPRP